MFQPEKLTVRELLQCYVDILAELRMRNVVRTENNPTGDYAEWLVAEKLNLTLEPSSNAGYDAVDAAGIRYQIKARLIHSSKKSRQLSAIRNLDSQDFDYLIALLFNGNFDVEIAIKIPHHVIGEYASYRQHVNAHILHLRGAILNDERVENITDTFKDESVIS